MFRIHYSYDDDQFNMDFPENDVPSFKYLDKIPDFVTVNSFEKDFESNNITDNVDIVNKSEPINPISKHRPMFKFRVLESAACESKSVTLLCELVYQPTRHLEIWYFGSNVDNGKLLKVFKIIK